MILGYMREGRGAVVRTPSWGAGTFAAPVRTPTRCTRLEVTQKGDQLEGRFLNRSAHATPLAWIRLEGKALVIQGDHSRVSFRKMVVTPITKSASSSP